MSIRWRRALELTAVFILLANVPLVLFFETQALLPSWMFPKLLNDLLKWHVQANGDLFLLRSPPFYIGIIVGDIVIRVPFMFMNAYAFYYGRSWGRVTATLYGVHTASTMIPMVFELYFTRASKRYKMVLVWTPQFLVAVYSIYRGLTEDTGPIVYDSATPTTATRVLSSLAKVWLWFPSLFWFPTFSVLAPTHAGERQVVPLVTSEVVREETTRRSRSQRGGIRRRGDKQTPATTSTEKVQVESSASIQRPAGPSTTSTRKLQVTATSAPEVSSGAATSSHLQIPLLDMVQKLPWPFSSSASNAGGSEGVSHVELVSGICDDQPGSSRKSKKRAGRRSRSRSKSKQREDREGGDEDSEGKSKTRRIALQDFINNATIVVRNS